MGGHIKRILIRFSFFLFQRKECLILKVLEDFAAEIVFVFNS